MNKTYQELCDEVLLLREQLASNTREHAALLANATTMRDLAGILLCIDQCEECRYDGTFDRAAVKRVLAETPTESLARLQNELHALVLEEFATEMEADARSQHHPQEQADARGAAMLARGAAYRRRHATHAAQARGAA